MVQSSGVAGLDESVADTGRGQELRPPWSFARACAGVGSRGPKRLGLRRIGRAPDLGEQCFVGQHPTPVPRQFGEQSELLAGQWQRCAGERRHMRVAVDLQIPDRDHGGVGYLGHRRTVT